MKYLPDSIGLYIHIPFCKKKCRYCDFYSAVFSEKVYSDYLSALVREMRSKGAETERPVDTVYLGGGTPSLLGDDILPLMSAVRESFAISSGVEITAECNPNSDFSFLRAAKLAGVNRLSFGVQSGNDAHLKTLGRTHTAADSVSAVKAAREAGFYNISVDLMICLPDSDIKTLKSDIDFICSLDPEHVSAYMLSIEPGTAFYKQQNLLNIPGEDRAAEQYLALCETLEKRGFEHYEISNFARENKKSRHNLKYWRCEEYLGIGPSAHSYISGKRFYYPRDIKAFIAGNEPVPDGEGGTREERIMLALRLSDGVPISDFGAAALKKAEGFKEKGLLDLSGGRLRLTDSGMIISNGIITELLYEDI